MEWAILFSLLLILVFIGIWIKGKMKWDGRFTIEDLIRERGGNVINIEKVSFIDQIIYSGKIGYNYATFYHVKYENEEGALKECVVRKLFLLSPTVFKEYIPNRRTK